MGDYPAISISPEALQRGLNYCKHCLLGRIDLQKVPIERVRELALQKWNPTGEWLITPIGKGYLFIRFDNVTDLNRVWSAGSSWSFDDEPLRLSQWIPNFTPETQKQTHALVWVKLTGLSQEYWEPEILMSIARGVGNPMRVDEKTLKRDFGYFANVLVDVDLAEPIPDQVYVKTPSFEFWQPVEIPKYPKFCSHCKVVGHLVTECRKLKRVMDNKDKANDQANKGKAINAETRETNVPIKGRKQRDKQQGWARKDTTTDVAGTSIQNRFNVLEVIEEEAIVAACDSEIEPDIMVHPVQARKETIQVTQQEETVKEPEQSIVVVHVTENEPINVVETLHVADKELAQPAAVIDQVNAMSNEVSESEHHRVADDSLLLLETTHEAHEQVKAVPISSIFIELPISDAKDLETAASSPDHHQ
ncbi:zinc ion binding / nucleic acid binding protein, partial [Thalictrum thalictroides]